MENMTYDQQLISEGLCPELIMYRDEDGMHDGRCMLPIVKDGYACEGHTAQIEAWQSQTEEERAYWERQQDLNDW